MWPDCAKELFGLLVFVEGGQLGNPEKKPRRKGSESNRGYIVWRRAPLPRPPSSLLLSTVYDKTRQRIGIGWRDGREGDLFSRFLVLCWISYFQLTSLIYFSSSWVTWNSWKVSSYLTKKTFLLQSFVRYVRSTSQILTFTRHSSKTYPPPARDYAPGYELSRFTTELLR